jgi:hypothetical protein
MANYGDCALTAFHRAKAGEDPVSAWKNAAAVTFPERMAAQVKGCPKGAFLGLCEEGLVGGVARGRYTRSKDNKNYAISAVEFLKSAPHLSRNANALWQLIPGHPPNENGQMQVVIALWQAGAIA